MNKFEKAINKKKSQIDELKVPEELETRLRNSLKNRCTSKNSMRKKRIKVAVLLIVAVLMGYNSDTLAFYGKKLIGYNNIMSGNLKQLNELGKGQMIGESYTFQNGVTVTLDGVMVDDHQLLAFYTISSLDHPIGEMDHLSIGGMDGIVGIDHIRRGGQGEIDESKNEIKWIQSFDPPYFFEKKLTWKFYLRNECIMEEGNISFTLDRNKAMGHTLKKRIHKSIEVDEREIRFESILASPTVTCIKGKLQSIFELGKDQILDERWMPQELDIRLIANGKELEKQSSGMSTDMKGVRFDAEFSRLPTDLKELQIKLVRLSADHEVDRQIKIEKDGNEKSIEIQGENIKINKVYESEGETYITITTKKSVILSRVYLMVDGEKVELYETINDEYDKKEDATITRTRTLRFKGTGNELKLHVKRLRYNTIYDKVIDIPLD